jgi:flap endonuclease GEN
MGVKQLWPLLEEANVVERWSGSDPASLRSLAAELEGSVVAVDLSMWLMEATTQGALAPHFSPVESAAKVAFERSINLLRFGVTPVFVLEGLAPAEKADTQRRRLGWAPGATSSTAARPSSTIFTRLGDQVAGVLRAMGFLVLQAPGEAEAACAALCTAGAVHAVLSFDGDTLLFGAGTVFRTLKLSAARDSTTEASRCTLDAVKRALGLTAPGAGPRAMALLGGLMGCDYDAQGAMGVGPTHALALVRYLIENSGTGDDNAILDAFDALLALPADTELLSLTQCTGCRLCGHEGGRKGKIKAHSRGNPCPCCPAAAVPPGLYCCEQPEDQQICMCAFHARAGERRIERVLERLRSVPGLAGRVREAADVYARGAAEAAAYVQRELAQMGHRPGQKLTWQRRPRVEAVAAAIAALPGPRMLIWDLSTVRVKTLPALLEWDLRQGAGAQGLEFRPTAVKKVHGSAGADAAWRYLVEFKRTEADVESLGRKLRDVEAEKEASQGSEGGSSQPPASIDEDSLISAVDFDRRWLVSGVGRSHRPVRVALLKHRWPAVEAAWSARAAAAPAPRTARKKEPPMPKGAMDRFLVPRRREEPAVSAAAEKPAAPAAPRDRGLEGSHSHADSEFDSLYGLGPLHEEQQESPAKRQRGTPQRAPPPDTPAQPHVPQTDDGMQTLQKLVATRTARRERAATGLLPGVAAAEDAEEAAPETAALDRVRRRGGEVGRMLASGGAVEVISLLGDEEQGGGAPAAATPQRPRSRRPPQNP